jgi:hypothetical protein
MHNPIAVLEVLPDQLKINGDNLGEDGVLRSEDYVTDLYLYIYIYIYNNIYIYNMLYCTDIHMLYYIYIIIYIISYIHIHNVGMVTFESVREENADQNKAAHSPTDSTD